MSTTKSVVTTRALRRLFDVFKQEVERNGNIDLIKKIYVASRELWVTIEEFRDSASRQDLLNFFSDYIHDRGGSLRPAVALELVVALCKVKSVNFEKLIDLIFVEIELDNDLNIIGQRCLSSKP